MAQMSDTTPLVFLDESNILLAGYHISLSPKESELLLAIKGQKRSVGNSDALSVCPVLVCSINKKSRRICGRKLIIFNRDTYIINPHS